MCFFLLWERFLRQREIIIMLCLDCDRSDNNLVFLSYLFSLFLFAILCPFSFCAFVIFFYSILIQTSLAIHFMILQASPAGLLGCFAPLGYALCTCILADFKLGTNPAIFIQTSLVSHFMILQASPAGLLGRFAPSDFALRTHILTVFILDNAWPKWSIESMPAYI